MKSLKLKGFVKARIIGCNFFCNANRKEFNKICTLHVVLVCKLNDNTVNERFKYQCSKDVTNTTFRVYARYQVRLDNEYTLETSCL